MKKTKGGKGKVGSREKGHPDVRKKLEKDGRARRQQRLPKLAKPLGTNASPAQKPRKTIRSIKGEMRQVEVRREKGRERVRILDKKKTYQEKYDEKVKNNPNRVMPKVLTRDAKLALNHYVEEDKEWGGAMDFELGLQQPERVHMSRGQLDMSETDEFSSHKKKGGKKTVVPDDFELMLHTHPSTITRHGRERRTPSAADLTHVTFTKPQLIVTREGKKPANYVLVTSLHDNYGDQAAFDYYWQKAAEGTRDSQGHYTRQTVRKLKTLLNEVGYDFKQVNPSDPKHPIFLNRDKQKERVRVLKIKRRAYR